MQQEVYKEISGMIVYILVTGDEETYVDCFRSVEEAEACIEEWGYTDCKIFGSVFV